VRKFAAAADLWYVLRMARIAVLLCILAGTARADDLVRLEVAVGETVERDVGFAMGMQCDDLTIVHAELAPGTAESNTFRVTGVAEGTTRCRAGTAPNRPAYVFEIHVVAAHRRP
jgi:hypothetical protein